MKLSKRTEYGLQAVVRLAQLPPRRYVQARDLAEQGDIPSKFLESILLALRRGGFLESKVGSGGGYRLTRLPQDICLGDLIRRLEGRLTINENNDIPASELAPGQIASRIINNKLTKATEQALNDLTLAQLIDDVQKAGSGQHAMYYI